MDAHPVRVKLGREILPYVVSSRGLWKQWFCVLHSLFGYTTDILVALTTIGLGSPFLSFLADTGIPAGEAASAPFVKTLSNLPSNLYYATVAFAILWIILRVAFSREEGQKRAVLARSCRNTFKQVEAKLHRHLVKADPMSDLNKMLDEIVIPTVDRSIQEGAWPWSGPNPNVISETDELLDRFCSQYEEGWAEAPQLGRVA